MDLSSVLRSENAEKLGGLVMLSITIDRTKGNKPIKFDWEATPEEFERLFNHVEKLAESAGHEPRDAAAQAIGMAARRGERSKEAERRGQRIWIVYAVLRYAQENIVLDSMVDMAGVITGPATIFDLAAHQHVKAEMRIRNNKIEMNVSGRSPLDS